jgi:hypothetical protein
MSDIPPVLSNPSGAVRSGKKSKGFFPPAIVRTVAFYIISLCIVASVVVCILAIWDFAKKDALWRLVASFVIVAAGTALFTFVNSVFGEEKDS